METGREYGSELIDYSRDHQLGEEQLIDSSLELNHTGSDQTTNI